MIFFLKKLNVFLLVLMTIAFLSLHVTFFNWILFKLHGLTDRDQFSLYNTFVCQKSYSLSEMAYIKAGLIHTVLP